MDTVEIVTPAGRRIYFSSAAATAIAESGLTGQIDTDVDGLVAGHSAAALLASCQEMAPDIAGWGDYCDAIVRTADREIRRASAVRDLGLALERHVVACRSARDSLREAEGVTEATERTLLDAGEITRVLRRLCAGRSIRELHAAFGAPGDWGYDTPIGDALATLYRC